MSVPYGCKKFGRKKIECSRPRARINPAGLVVLVVLLLGVLWWPGLFQFGKGGKGQDGFRATDGQQTSVPVQTAPDRTPEQQPPDPPTSGTVAIVVHVYLLGDRTLPPYRPINRFFALQTGEGAECYTADEILGALQKKAASGQRVQVKLIYGLASTSPRNPEVQRLIQEISSHRWEYSLVEDNTLLGPKDRP
ncbi:MAG: hypothetical protein C4297_02900 [Gemmataceae bacterium]